MANGADTDNLVGAPLDTVGLHPRWQAARDAVELLAIAPGAIGGIRLRGRHGPVRTAWLAELTELMGPDQSFVVPAHVTDDRLVGAIDLAATLASGRRMEDPGLLSRVPPDGCVVMPGYERFSANTLGLITQGFDRAGSRPRGGFAIVAIDEAEDDPDQEAIRRLRPNAIDDRLGLWLDIDGLSMADCGFHGALPAPDATRLREQRDRARERFAGVRLADERIEQIAGVAALLGITGLRAVMAAMAVARAAAARAGRDAVADDDVALAVTLCLAPRATQMPELPDEDVEEAEDDQPEPDDTPPDEEQDTPPTGEPQPLDDQMIEAVAALLPPELLDALAAEAARPPSSGGAGSSGAVRKAGRRGRAFGARHGAPDGRRRLNIIETLRASAPWQKLRATTPATQIAARDHPRRVHVRKADFRIYRQKERSETVAVFVVDASGSSAVQRFGEAKGAIELLLGQSYARRDHVALIAVRGQQAELLLPPTRSLTRAKRLLAGLPGGGGTPLASGLDLGLMTAEASAHRGQSPMIVVLTDGQANVARDGRQGRAGAEADVSDAASRIMGRAIPSIVLDTSNRPQPRAAKLAETMGARYLPLSRAGADQLARVVTNVADAAKQEPKR